MPFAFSIHPAAEPLLDVDLRIGASCNEQVSSEHDCLIREIDNEVAAGMSRRPVEESNADAVNLHGFAIGDGLRGKANLQIRITPGNGRFLFGRLRYP